MPDSSLDEKHRLRREARRIAHRLIANDEVKQGAIVLLDYRLRFADCHDGFCRWGLPLMFLVDLAEGCQKHQVKQVSYLIDEFAPECSQIWIDILRRHELRMFRRFKDVEGVRKSIWLLDGRINGLYFGRRLRKQGGAQ